MSRAKFFLVGALGLLGLASPMAAAEPGKGYVLFEYFYDIGPGTAVSDLTSNAKFPNSPDSSEWLPSFLAPAGVTGGGGIRDNYGVRGRAYVVPPQTGDYTFWVAGDDLCELWLSTDDTAANAKLIARVTGWTPAQDWTNTAGGSTDTAAMKSTPIPLKAGQKYYIEGLMKEAGGGESIGVAWAGPGVGASPTLLDGKYCYAFMRTPEPMLMARNPSPADEAVGISAPLLQWTVGATAMFHDVYFGTDPNPPQVASRQLFTLYYHIAGLTPGATYYWKVNEIEADGVTIHEGPLWSFVAQAVTAYYPSPTDGASSVSPNVTLTWQPGTGAVKHQVYLSDSLDAVTQGTAAADKGQTEATSFAPTGLEGATTYYWRVDEIGAGATVKAGPVWSFTTFILVDDFESYNDDIDAKTTIFDTWIDGLTTGLSGSVVGNSQAPFAERTIVHGGLQAMPMDYDNSKTPFLSEAEKEFSLLQDWSVGGVDTLSLWVRGQAVAFRDKGGDAYTVSGSGHDIWDNADDFRFAYQRLSGNGSITARVDSLVATNAWAKAGVMIRESLDGGARHGAAVITPGNGMSFPYRAASSGSSNQTNQTGFAPPFWVRITRTGNAFKAERSADGKTWAVQDVEQTILMAPDLYIGLCVTSHDTALTTTAEFSNVTTTGGVTGAWQVAEVGDDPQPANGLAGLYVVIADSAGKSALVPHPDPGAANLTAYTEWKIPLSSLTGVNLAKVKKMVIGVGNKENPAAGGTGRVYVDDIRVTKP